MSPEEVGLGIALVFALNVFASGLLDAFEAEVEARIRRAEFKGRRSGV